MAKFELGEAAARWLRAGEAEPSESKRLSRADTKKGPRQPGIARRQFIASCSSGSGSPC